MNREGHVEALKRAVEQYRRDVALTEEAFENVPGQYADKVRAAVAENQRNIVVFERLAALLEVTRQSDEVVIGSVEDNLEQIRASMEALAEVREVVARYTGWREPESEEGEALN